MTFQTVKQMIVSSWFHRSLMILGVIFILLTPFISLKPESLAKYGYPGIFIYNILASGLLIIPILITKFNLLFLIIASALGNAVNTSINYFVGTANTSLLKEHKLMSKIKEWLRKVGLWGVYILAILPLPLDVNGLLSGYLNISYPRYLLVNFLGKLTIFLLVGLGIISFAKH